MNPHPRIQILWIKILRLQTKKHFSETLSSLSATMTWLARHLLFNKSLTVFWLLDSKTKTYKKYWKYVIDCKAKESSPVSLSNILSSSSHGILSPYAYIPITSVWILQFFFRCSKTHKKITKVGTTAQKYTQVEECRLGLRCTCRTQPVSHFHLTHKTAGQWGPIFLSNCLLGAMQILGHIYYMNRHRNW